MCVCAACGCLCSLWTGPGHTLYAAAAAASAAAGCSSSSQLPRNVETRYIRPREWLGGSLWIRYPKRESKKAVRGQTVTVSLCIPPSRLSLLPLCSCWHMLDRGSERENNFPLLVSALQQKSLRWIRLLWTLVCVLLTFASLPRCLTPLMNV